MFAHMYLHIYFILFLFLTFNLSLMLRNFNLAKPQGTFLPDPKCTVFLCTQSCAVLNQVMPLLLNFGPFSHSNLLLFCISVSSLTWHQLMRFSFRDFTIFYIFLSSKVKKHICILWNPSICFDDDDNNNNNNNNNKKYFDSFHVLPLQHSFVFFVTVCSYFLYKEKNIKFFFNIQKEIKLSFFYNAQKISLLIFVPV